MSETHRQADSEDQNVRLFHGFFPEDILGALTEYLDRAELRKSRFSLGPGAAPPPPECILAAAAYAEGLLGYGYDIALIKWYRSSDAEESGAYDLHRDPVEDTGAPLFLSTLRGEARLTYLSEDDREHSLVSRANDVIILKDPTLRHRISPPLGATGERYFLFFGRHKSI